MVSRAQRWLFGCPPEKLIRPLISEGEYRFQRINVAGQRLEFNSLLNWTERAVRTRKECPEFGWGELKFLKTDHPSVIAHTSTWRGHTVAAVHNFSRATATVRVHWPEGVERLHHLFGRDLADPLPESPDVVDLDGYDYRWMRLIGGPTDAAADRR